MARKSPRLRERSNSRLNRKAKTRTAKRLNERRAENKKRTPPKASLRESVRKQVRQVSQAVTATGKRLTVIRGPKQVDSSWVDSIAYVRYGSRNGVAVRFLSGADVFYPNTDIRDYEYLRDAASKGRAIHRRFYDLPYELM